MVMMTLSLLRKLLHTTKLSMIHVKLYISECVTVPFNISKFHCTVTHTFFLCLLKGEMSDYNIIFSERH